MTLRQVVASCLTAGGVVMIVLSLFWANWRDPTSGWSQSQATEFQQLSGDVHSLSFTAETEADKQKLAEAKQRFAELKDQLETAQGSGSREAWYLRIAGIVLVAAGWFALPSQQDLSDSSR